MPQTIEEFRQNVQDTFAAGLGVSFLPGKLVGPNQSRDWLGSCHVQHVQEDPRNVLQQQVFLNLRLFAPFVAQRSPNKPYDPAPLEQMAEKLLQVMEANQTGLGAWFQRVTSIAFDPDNQGLEAVVFAYSSNPGTVTY